MITILRPNKLSSATNTLDTKISRSKSILVIQQRLTAFNSCILTRGYKHNQNLSIQNCFFIGFFWYFSFNTCFVSILLLPYLLFLVRWKGLIFLKKMIALIAVFWVRFRSLLLSLFLAQIYFVICYIVWSISNRKLLSKCVAIS